MTNRDIIKSFNNESLLLLIAAQHPEVLQEAAQTILSGLKDAEENTDRNMDKVNGEILNEYRLNGPLAAIRLYRNIFANASLIDAKKHVCDLAVNGDTVYTYRDLDIVEEE